VCVSAGVRARVRVCWCVCTYVRGWIAYVGVGSLVLCAWMCSERSREKEAEWSISTHHSRPCTHQGWTSGGRSSKEKHRNKCTTNIDSLSSQYHFNKHRPHSLPLSASLCLSLSLSICRCLSLPLSLSLYIYTLCMRLAAPELICLRNCNHELLLRSKVRGLF